MELYTYIPDSEEASYSATNTRNSRIAESLAKGTWGASQESLMIAEQIPMDEKPPEFSHPDTVPEVPPPESPPPALAPTVVEPLLPIVARLKQKVRLLCKIDGRPEPEIFWYHGKKVLQESENIGMEKIADGRQSLTLRELRPGDEGIYSCRGFNTFGSTLTQMVLIIEDLDRKETGMVESVGLLAEKVFESAMSGAEEMFVKQIHESLIIEETTTGKFQIFFNFRFI